MLRRFPSLSCLLVVAMLVIAPHLAWSRGGGGGMGAAAIRSAVLADTVSAATADIRPSAGTPAVVTLRRAIRPARSGTARPAPSTSAGTRGRTGQLSRPTRGARRMSMSRRRAAAAPQPSRVHPRRTCRQAPRRMRHCPHTSTAACLVSLATHTDASNAAPRRATPSCARIRVRPRVDGQAPAPATSSITSSR